MFQQWQDSTLLGAYPVALVSFHLLFMIRATQTQSPFEDVEAPRTAMADQYRSFYNVLEDLGVPPSDHEFLRRLFASEYPFPGPSSAEPDPNSNPDSGPGHRGSVRLSAASSPQILASIPTRQVIPFALVAVLD
jgi:hypothetical protein